jgi:hypothetical protein
MAYRACMRAALLVLLILMYLLFWYTCDMCVFWLAVISCGASFGAPFLRPGCLGGVVCAFIKGVHLGAGPLHFDVKWDA